ncbi:unnamed protein product [Schistocephalus solidus]|uniref:Arrestin_C domain-containing protein n=1 Tax=Schistocephalus solidus TaxID=70667 RepID=A0A183SX11_SCHSO|nr:unnamed protein product [Schistocephalus solidus]
MIVRKLTFAPEGVILNRSSVRMIVRKLTFAPEEPGPQPSAEVSREFLMSVGCLRVEAMLDKQKYYHGESIAVNVLVDNNSMKTVKRIKLYTSVCLPNANHYKCNVAELQSDEGFPISPSQTGWCKIYRLCPLLSNNRDKPGLALDGDLKNEDTNLASSTMASPKSSHEPMGIIVRYKVKIRLVLDFSPPLSLSQNKGKIMDSRSHTQMPVAKLDCFTENTLNAR